MILALSYYNIALSLKELKKAKRRFSSMDPALNKQEPMSFLANGLKLCKKYLGDQHVFS